MYKKWGILLLSWFLLISWMVMIFLFSSQTGSDSGDLSEMIATWFGNVFHVEPDTIHLLIRKLAHFTVYYILGLLLMNVLRYYISNVKQLIIFTIVFGFLYACSDEFHQLFISNRSGNIVDVFIDTSGVVLSTIPLLYLYRKTNKKFIKKD